jgi:hypothetical protein
LLREVHDRRLAGLGVCEVIDVDDEIVRLNGGIWPDIDTKNEQLLPLVLEAAAVRSEVVVFNSYMPIDRTRWLKIGGEQVRSLPISGSFCALPESP